MTLVIGTGNDVKAYYYLGAPQEALLHPFSPPIPPLQGPLQTHSVLLPLFDLFCQSESDGYIEKNCQWWLVLWLEYDVWFDLLRMQLARPSISSYVPYFSDCGRDDWYMLLHAWVVLNNWGPAWWAQLGLYVWVSQFSFYVISPHC